MNRERKETKNSHLEKHVVGRQNETKNIRREIYSAKACIPKEQKEK